MAVIPFTPAFKARHPRNIPASFYKPIGQILARWIYTELYMLSIGWHLLKIKDPKKARLLTWGLNPSHKVKFFQSISRWANPADKAELADICGKADKLRGIRNRLAHGLWGYKPGEKPRIWRLIYMPENEAKIMPSKKDVSLIKLSDLQKWADDLDALNIRLKALHTRLGAPVP